jgi:short subunit dehydrogenase-like uncharacterized protein
MFSGCGHFLKLADLEGNLNKQETPIVIADLAEQKSIDAMVQSTYVIISAAGPFKLIGTHYCDTTGGLLPRSLIITFYSLWRPHGP